MVTDDVRLATTGLILARRIATSILRNPEFNVTQMIQPPPHAYVSTDLTSTIHTSLTCAAVHQCGHRYHVDEQYSLWALEIEDWVEKHRPPSQTCDRVSHLTTKPSTALIDRYTVKSQLPPAIVATIIAIQFAANNKTTMVFLYMYVLGSSSSECRKADVPGFATPRFQRSCSWVSFLLLGKCWKLMAKRS